MALTQCEECGRGFSSLGSVCPDCGWRPPPPPPAASTDSSTSTLSTDSTAAIPDLEPLGFGEVLDAGFRLWRKNFVSFLAVAALVILPIVLIEAFYYSNQIVAIRNGFLFVESPSSYENTSTIFSLVRLVAIFLSNGAIAVVAVRGYLGQTTRPVEAYRLVFRRFFPFLGLMFLFIAGVGLGLILLVIPGIIVLVLWALALPAFWEENASPTEALKRSNELVKGRWWFLFGLLLVMWLIVYIIGGLVIGGIVFGAIVGQSVTLFVIAQVLTLVVMSMLMAPLLPAVTTVFYFDSRVRKEGFDVELQARKLDRVDPDPA